MPKDATMPTNTPHLLLLQEGRRGDDAQLRALAGALGWKREVVHLRRSLIRVALDRVTAALGLPGARDVARRVGPPWPDAVFVVGGRSIGAARHIRRRSGGRTRVVAVGRPWAALRHFDLVVTTPQYKLPAAGNVLHNRLPLNALDMDTLAAAAAEWRPRVAALPAPYVTVLLGGDSGSHRFDAATARRLAARADAHARAVGGSVLACASPRTPAEACEAFAAALTAPARVQRWQPEGAANPFSGFVGLADRLLVTGESASMLAEALSTGKPVETVALPMRRRAALLTRTVPDGLRRLGLAGPCARLSAALARRGLWVPAREMARVHRALAAAQPDERHPRADLDRAVAAVSALFPGHRPRREPSERATARRPVRRAA